MAEPRNVYVGLDVGGTSVKVGLFTEGGTLIGRGSVPTPPIVDEAGYAAVTGGVECVLADEGASPDDVRGIGLGLPCPVPANGDISLQANVDIDAAGLEAALRAACPHAAVKFVNDANAAAMGEIWAGAAKGHSSMVFVTLGTGVGGGVVVDGKIVAGAFGAGGEIGHMCINPDEQRVCGCGGRGHLEQYASATGLVSSYLAECEAVGVEPIALDGPSDSRSLFQACREGNEQALAAMRVMVDCLGRALTLVANVVDPEIFLLGGGTSASSDVFLEPLIERYRNYAISVNADTPIKVASLGNDAGMYGAAYVALQAATDEVVI